MIIPQIIRHGGDPPLRSERRNPASRSDREGVELIRVNPACTSTIGYAKFSGNGTSTHEDGGARGHIEAFIQRILREVAENAVA